LGVEMNFLILPQIFSILGEVEAIPKQEEEKRKQATISYMGDPKKIEIEI
jgi:hypothetical protein